MELLALQLMMTPKEQDSCTVQENALPSPTPLGMLGSGVQAKDLLEALEYSPSQDPSVV